MFFCISLSLSSQLPFLPQGAPASYPAHMQGQALCSIDHSPFPRKQCIPGPREPLPDCWGEGGLEEPNYFLFLPHLLNEFSFPALRCPTLLNTPSPFPDCVLLCPSLRVAEGHLPHLPLCACRYPHTVPADPRLLPGLGRAGGKASTKPKMCHPPGSRGRRGFPK